MKQVLLFSLFAFFYFHSFAFTTQNNWRWRNNNGSETSASWRAAQNQSIIINSIDSVYRLRIQLQNNTGNDKSFNTNLMYASSPGGPWRYITNFVGNNAFTLSNTNAYVTDMQLTTQQITGSSDTYTPGKILVKTNELDLPIANGTTSEYEYSIQPTNNIQANTTYYFQIPGCDYPVALPSLKTSVAINTKAAIVSNGSFEDSLHDWLFKVKGTAAATYSILDSSYKDGIKSILVNVTKAGALDDISVSHKDVTLKAAHIYMVRFWAKVKNNNAKMRLMLSGSKTLTYDYQLYTGWEQYQFAFKATDAKTQLSFFYQTQTQYIIDKIEILDENNNEVDVPMNYMWQNNRPENEYSWLSADGENSEPLPDGRTVWNFSDGWYGYNDTTTNSITTSQLLRNTLVVQSAAKPNGILDTKIGGTVSQPKPVMIPPDPMGYDDFFWPRDMTIENDSLKVLLPDVQIVHQGDNISDGHRIAIGVFSLPDLTLCNIDYMHFLDADTINYITLCKADDGYTYAYGARPINAFEAHAIVARFPTGHLSVTTPWQFLHDTGWSYDYHNSKEIADVQLYSVTRLGTNNYVALFLNPLSNKIEVEYAQSPIGPWVGRSIVGQTEGQDDVLSYFAVIHEETANNGVYSFSYSNNGPSISQVLSDKTFYWPSYMKADLKSLSPFNNSVLPVKLFSFTAHAEGNQIIQQWKTATETNNDHFVVQRSADGKNNWTDIATVKSKGNSLQSQSYLSYDEQPLNGDNYYRLLQVDKDGNTNVSEIRLVHIELNVPLVNVFPNPSHGDISFTLENYQGSSIQVQFSDINGKLLFNQKMPVQTKSKYKISLQQKPAAGIYNLVIKGDNLNQSTRMIIQ
jgi:hypothetical protein